MKALVRLERAPVAQLDRAIDFESIGREFEPLRARQAYALPVLVGTVVTSFGSSLSAVRCGHQGGMWSVRGPTADEGVCPT
jgi:hypothetical protein